MESILREIDRLKVDRFFNDRSRPPTTTYQLGFRDGMLMLPILIVLLLLWKRSVTRRKLESCGIPTVLYQPRFWNYQITDTRKLSASNITNIWPRMLRLKGPLDVYGTVYGISTMVVHVANVQVAQAVLNSSTSGSSQRGNDTTTASNSSKRPNRRTPVWKVSGACKAPAYNHFQDFCGQGVFTANDADWKAKRVAVMHALLRSPEGGGYESKIKEQASYATNQLVRFLKKQHSDTGELVNITPLLQRCTIGLIYRYITHSELSTGQNVSDDNEDSDDSDSCSSTTELSSPIGLETKKTKDDESEADCLALLRDYLDAITRIRMIILAQSRSLWFLVPRWVYRLFSSLFVQEQECMISIGAMARRACQEARPESPLSILQDSPLYRQNGDTDKGPSQNLLDEAITLLFAGQDTSAATLSWTLHLLSLHPRVQSKLAAEVLTCASSSSIEGVSSQAILKDLSYLNAVIRESMRLYPVAPFVVRRLIEPISATDKTRNESVTLPKDSLACIWIYSLHRSERYWTRPNDFWPERWLQREEKRDKGISCGAFMPFCIGPRNCVGQPLAHVILRTLLTRLMQNFEFVDDRLNDNTGRSRDDLRHKMQAGFTVLPLGGVPLLLRKR